MLYYTTEVKQGKRKKENKTTQANTKQKKKFTKRKAKNIEESCILPQVPSTDEKAKK